MNTSPLDYSRTLSGVSLTAVQINPPAGPSYWRVRVNATGTLLDQHYKTRPALWQDLETIARLVGDRFARDTLAA